MKTLPLDCCVCLRRIDFRDGIRAIPQAPGARVCSWGCMERLTDNIASAYATESSVVALLTATVNEQRRRAIEVLNMIEFEDLDAPLMLLVVRDHLQLIAKPSQMASATPRACAAKGGG